jgi:thiamine-phosphate pyrophosphorylase
VIEETVRFVLNDCELAKEIKRIREEYRSIVCYFGDDILQHRDSQTDIGKSNDFDFSIRRNIKDVVLRSFGRVEESMRVIEEYGKIINKDVSVKAKTIRFHLYALEKETINKLNKIIKSFGNDYGLYLILTNPNVGYQKLAEIAVDEGVCVIQLRDKSLDDNKLLRLAKELRGITQDSDTLFIVNDRVDIAILSEADGVHVGKNDISVSDIRKLSQRLIIGKSTHTLGQLKSVLSEYPDYVGIGPIFKTNTKKVPDKILGVYNAKIMMEYSNIPAVGIGGINDQNIEDVLNIGFRNFSIIKHINISENPKNAIRKINKLCRRYYDTKN